MAFKGLTRTTLEEVGSQLPIDGQLSPLEAAAIAFAQRGLDDALASAHRDAEQFRTAWHNEVLAILEAVYENDPPQPNDSDERGRSLGPDYRGLVNTNRGLHQEFEPSERM